MALLAEAVTVQDVRQGYGSLIFMGCFFLVAFVLFILWLRRG
jgi:hypothetical protein